ncbi:NitT/TauT family transport system substrate-binding protein [Natronocella acetinitrilica]|uniref:Thiamine pyrimidine synthase n=1 Tax=Natronocella acetinitrilica TaxID=414046 RepID=A0AAE3G6L2_9GAMM|nr:ABC transporter substrate-binding protein [Natronocella acetinitrilica]MCP1676740.1 NitT/TauT family transport system substrate-binding protein [Natronocella acetinitrilica]
MNKQINKVLSTRARRASLLGGLAAGLALSLLGSGNAVAQDRDEILLGMAIPFTLADGGIFAIGRELGYFDEENITVDTVILEGAGSVVPQVAQRNVDMGQPLPETLLSAYDPASGPLPVVYIFNAIPANTLELAVLESSDIHSISDLRGKRIGVGALTWGTIPQTRALLRRAGLTPGEDVEIVAVGVLGSGFHALRQGRVDALNYNHTWIDLLEQTGTKARRLPYPDLYARMVNNAFLVHRSMLEEQPDLLGRYGRAYSKSVVACDANPVACVNAFWRANPESRPDGDPDQVMEESLEIMAKRLDLLMRDENGETRRFGEFDLEVIQAYVQELYEAGELQTPDVPVTTYFSNDLVEQFNDFDMDAVIEQARAHE